MLLDTWKDQYKAYEFVEKKKIVQHYVVNKAIKANKEDVIEKIKNLKGKNSSSVERLSNQITVAKEDPLNFFK